MYLEKTKRLIICNGGSTNFRMSASFLMNLSGGITTQNQFLELVLKCEVDYMIISYLCFFGIIQADIHNSGTIDYIEFIAATLHLNKLEREEHLVAAFSYFDKDGSGYITVDELQQACKEHNMPAAFLDDVIKEADQDNVSILIFLC